VEGKAPPRVLERRLFHLMMLFELTSRDCRDPSYRAGNATGIDSSSLRAASYEAVGPALPGKEQVLLHFKDPPMPWMQTSTSGLL